MTASEVVVPEPNEKLVPVMRPVLDTEKSVDETPLLEVEAIAKRLLSTEVEAACIPKVAN